ncbi:MAG: aldehyde ferredoxin oxidoreductase family protein [Pseudomonadota bacterium]
MKGFFNRVLYVNLTQATHEAVNIPDEVLRDYLGGKGLGSYLLSENNRAKVDPFSSENHLIFAAGCVTDTKVHGSSRYGVFTKSPLTGIYSESYSGGSLGEYLSRTGYDAIILRGSSKDPIYLEISDSDVKFHEAKEIWGKDTYETEETVKQRISPNKAGVAVIGPAGENLVRFSTISNNFWRCAGRTGTGAVMGSKRVKAIAFHGNKKREVANPGLLELHWKEMLKKGKDDPGVLAYRQLGTPMMVSVMNSINAFPTRYWSKGSFEKWQKISAESLLERCKVKASACPKCFLACGKLSEVVRGRHKGLRLEGPEYETIYAFGGLCMVEEIEEILYLNDICDKLGVDTITGGNLAAFAIEASKRGVIGDRLEYGDVDAIAELLHKIVYRQGLGSILAEGILHASKEWGLEDIAIHVKGMEPAGYDPRVLKGMGLAYATSDRGACHLRTTFYKPELAGIIDPEQIDGKAKLLIDYEDKLTIFDTLILCKFFRDMVPWSALTTIVDGTTGLKLGESGLRKIASNISNTVRKFNVREGVARSDDTLPPRFFSEKLGKEKKVINRKDFNRILDDYYRLRGWDSKGIPPNAK